MKLRNALRLYWVRLRARLVQECFAVAGIAAGVALLFASQIASSSMQNAVGDLSRGIAGGATLQLAARGQATFAAGTLRRVRAIPGVRSAAPLLEVAAQAGGPKGSASVMLIGADENLVALGGELVRRTALSPFGHIGAVVLPASLASAIGVTHFGAQARLQVGARSATAPLYAQLTRAQVGALAQAPVALVPLPFAQQVAGLSSRVSRVLIRPAAGRAEAVARALRAIAGRHLNVEPIEHDQRVFAQAAAASSKSTLLFAVISALVGFLFAFNAALFAAPQRRRAVAELHNEGFGWPAVISVLLLDAFALGVLACTLGLIAGEELSIHVLRTDPAFLSLAFSFGSERAVSAGSVAIAVGGGLLAAFAAVLLPASAALTPDRDPLTATPGRATRLARTPRGLALAGCASAAAASAILLYAPQAAVWGMVLLVCALLLTLPVVLDLVLALLRAAARAFRGAVPHLAAMELTAHRSRALAISATGAMAVFGSVAVQGAHDDLLRGLETAAHESYASSALWVMPSGDYDLLGTAPFAPAQRATLARVPGVGEVRPYRAGLLDLGDRRLLVSAPPAGAETPLAPGQVVQGGEPRELERRLRTGGWLAISAAVAREHHLGLGQTIVLPTPAPIRLRLAALITNLGWAPGAIVMNGADYARAWASTEVGAYGISLAPGTSAAEVALGLERALGSHSALRVLSSARRAELQDAVSRQALARLSQIATLILAAAVLALGAAIGALIWQRRAALAKLRLDGISRAQLWRTTLLESLLLLGAGCSAGAAFGLYSKQLADRVLARAIDFPVSYSLSFGTTLRSLSLVVATALVLLSVPGYLAASAPPSLALQD